MVDRRKSQKNKTKTSVDSSQDTRSREIRVDREESSDQRSHSSTRVLRLDQETIFKILKNIIRTIAIGGWMLLTYKIGDIVDSKLASRDAAFIEYKGSVEDRFKEMEAIQDAKNAEQDKKLSGDDRRLCALEVKGGGLRCEPRE